MSNRALIVLSAVLIALVILVNVGQRDTRESISAGQRFLPRLQNAVNDIDVVTIATAGNDTVATLERQADRWVVRERDGYPADVSKLREALIALAEARILEPKTANPSFYARLGVEPIELDDASGTAITLHGAAEPLTVILGDRAAGGQRFARLADDAESYLIDRDPTLPRSTGLWLDAEILDLPGDRVQAVTITHADGEIVRISKAAAAQTNFSVEPIPEGRELLYPGVAGTVGGAFRALSLEDVERIDEDVDVDEDVTVELRTFDGLVLTATGTRRGDQAWVSFRAAAEQEDRAEEAATLNGRLDGWRYRISTFQYEQMTRRMDDLLQAAA